MLTRTHLQWDGLRTTINKTPIGGSIKAADLSI